MLGFLVMSIFNIVLVVVLNKLFINNGLISLAYFLVLPLVGIITYYWFEKLKLFKTKNKLNKLNLSSVIEKRKNLISKIDLLCPKI
jgi:hypothetical protein